MITTKTPFQPIPITLEDPDRTIPESEKDEQYHLAKGVNHIGRVDVGAIDNYRAKWEVNCRMYSGDQWFHKEDTETFLKDDNNNELKRIQVVANMIKPAVEQYRGNVNRMIVSASVDSRTRRSKTRKEVYMMKMLLLGRIARSGPAMQEAIGSRYQVGQNDQEQYAVADQNYQDKLCRAGTDMLTAIAKLNKFDQQRKEHAWDVITSGACWWHSYIHGHHQRYEVVRPNEIVFDTSKMRSLTFEDASFWGIQRYHDLSTILERWHIDSDTRTYLSKALKTQSDNDGNGSRTIQALGCMVNFVYWRDLVRTKIGFVKGPDGLPMQARIDYTAPSQVKPKYTESDVIPPPENAPNKHLFGNKKIIMGDAEVIRYVVWISSAHIPPPSGTGRESLRDIVLDYGQCKLQEVDPDETERVNFPCGGSAYAIVDKRIVSPIDDLVSPQRFKNRSLSVLESHLESSAGAGAVLDGSMIDPKMMKYETIARNIKLGKPVLLNSRGKGLPNSFGHYDYTPKQGVYAIAELLGLMDNIGQASTGIHEPMTGSPSGGTQLVRTTQLLIQRGSIMQEMVYDAITSCDMQKYQNCAQAGKTHYAFNPYKLVELIGDEHAATIISSVEFLVEQFRAEVKRENSEQQRIDQANDLLNFFLSNGLIDRKRYAELYNNAYMSDVTAAVRSFIQDQEQMAKQMQQMQQQSAEAQRQAMREADLQRQVEDSYSMLVDQAAKEAEGMRKRDQLYARENAKHVMAPQESQPVA